MIVKSPYLDKEFTIPDEKLPDAPRFSMKCPFTGKKIVFERGNDGFDVRGAELPPPTEAPKPVVLDLPVVEPDAHPVGMKTAFVYAPGPFGEGVTSALKGKQYAVSTAADELEAIARLRLNPYCVVIVEESPETKQLLSEINSWNADRRREVNVIVVGDKGQSLDPAMAFQASANAYFNASDVAKIEELLEGAIKGYGSYYQLYETAKQQVQG